MIPGHPPRTTYRTIIGDDFGVNVCGSNVGCPKELGWLAHRNGRVDRAGGIHWFNVELRATRKGMRNLMKLMALVERRDFWNEPKWKQLYLTNVWATLAIRNRYHYRIKRRWSMADRKLALKLYQAAPQGSLRHQHRGVYKWLLDAGLVGNTPVRSLQREGVSPPE